MNPSTRDLHENSARENHHHHRACNIRGNACVFLCKCGTAQAPEDCAQCRDDLSESTRISKDGYVQQQDVLSNGRGPHSIEERTHIRHNRTGHLEGDLMARRYRNQFFYDDHHENSSQNRCRSVQDDVAIPTSPCCHRCDPFDGTERDLDIFYWSPSQIRSNVTSNQNPRESLRMMVTWLSHDWHRRFGFATHILHQIPVFSMKTTEFLDFIDEMDFHSRLQKHREIKCLALDITRIWLKNHTCQDSITVEPLATEVSQEADVEESSLPFSESPSSYCSSDSPTILLLGGGNPTCPIAHQEELGVTVYQFLPATLEWQLMGHSPQPIHHAACAVLDRTIYVCGGWNEVSFNSGMATVTKSAINDMWSLNPCTKKWTRLSPMRRGRVHHCMVAADDKLFVFGGMDNDESILSSVECYDRVADIWQEVSVCPRPLAGLAACFHRSLIWIAGGVTHAQDLATGTFSSHVLVYNPRKNRWYSSYELRIPRAFAALVSCNDKLFVVGGKSFATCNGDSSDVDVLDFDGERWRHCTDMLLPRYCFSHATIGNDIYIIGGISASLGSILSSVECFNTIQSQWTLLRSELPAALAGATCCVVEPVEKHR